MDQIKEVTSTNPVKYFSRQELTETLDGAVISISDEFIAKPEASRYAYYSTGAVYEGTWFHGMRHGEGTMRWADGANYQGIWHCGMAYKFGKFNFPNGDLYEGCWTAN